VVARLDHASRADVNIAGERLQLTAAAGLGWVGPRPLPLGTESESIWQLDLALSARVRFLELGFSIENLFDRRNHASEFNYPSHFGDDEGVRSQRATRHFAAGAPRLWLLTLTAYVDDVDPTAGGSS
jgi:iron complex outermembrane receptor protein